MLQKTKIIIIVLAALLMVSLFFILNISRLQKTTEKERDDLKEQNATLDKKIEEGGRENKRLQGDLSKLNAELERINKDKDEIRRRYELATKDKEDLLEKLKSAKAEVERIKESSSSKKQQEQQAPPSTNDVYWAGILKAKTDLEVQLSNIKNDLKMAQIAGEQLKREKTGLELDVKNFNRQNEEIKQQLSYDQRIVDSISQELVIERNNKIQLENSAKVMKTENAMLRRQLRSLNERKSDLEKKMAELQYESRGLKDNLAKIEAALNDRSLMIEDLKRQMGSSQKDGIPEEEGSKQRSSVELPPIVVRPQQEPLSANDMAQKKGEVVLVNKDNNFVIINFGEDTGVKTGDSFKLYRDGRYVGNIEAIQVRRNYTACDIKQEESPIRVGDEIQ